MKSNRLKPVKPFLTYDQQIAHLQSDKGLIITDEAKAKTTLANVSYYALIGGYKSLFYNPSNRTYKHGTTFNDIVALYLFDDDLRDLVFKYSRRVEGIIRSSISYSFCEKYSNLQHEYLNLSHYQNTRKNFSKLARLISTLNNEANVKTDHDYIVYQRRTYGNVPLYAVTKTLTLGQISTMYSLLEPSIQIKICRNFKNVSVNDLIMYLRVLTHFRNVCAHNERLFSFKDRYDIPDTPLHKKLDIPLKGRQYIYGKHDLFSVVIIFRYLLSAKEFKKFKSHLERLIKNAVKNSTTLSEAELLTAMGFPSNWKNITRYRV